ncbi:hypothetical protein FMM56_06155 [Campylobacter sp. LR264d]|uniref:hypothetical protein n=1 Tax=Campylobacter sp. LR264d TaxID=2593544 RepID=UPI00123B0533|nr:hypothetical protein [Campylobacter sp. LR264d]KAA6230404.1 hypothetical protein FMM56_06155 [Campylobacter sp. LR264d]
MACTNKTQVIENVRVERLKIPSELLTLKPLKKPIIENERDIIKAYSHLFQAYKECEINIQKIKELQEN